MLPPAWFTIGLVLGRWWVGPQNCGQTGQSWFHQTRESWCPCFHGSFTEERRRSGHCFLTPEPGSYSVMVVLWEETQLFQMPSRIKEAAELSGKVNAAEFCCYPPQICASSRPCVWALQAAPLASWLGCCSDVQCPIGVQWIDLPEKKRLSDYEYLS